MRKFFFLPLFFLQYFSFSQTNKKHQIVGSLHYFHSVISYGTLIFNHKESSINSDELGNFSFNWNGQLDTLFIECVGFKKEQVILDKAMFKDSLDIEMKPLSTNFIDNKTIYLKGKHLKYGAEKNLFRSIYPAFGNTLQCGLKFDEEKLWGKQIKKVRFFLLQNEAETNLPFRIRIYDLHNGLPINDLSNFNFICSIHKAGWNEFDLEEFKIFIPQSGCFIAMEWIISDSKYKMFDSTAKKDIMYGQQIGLSYHLENHKGLLKYNMDAWLTNKEMNSNYKFFDEGFYYSSPMIKLFCK
jgi:hypothetical protein